MARRKTARVERGQLEVDGQTFHWELWGRPPLLKVSGTGGTRTTQLGGSTVQSLGLMLAHEILAEEKKAKR